MKTHASHEDTKLRSSNYRWRNALRERNKYPQLVDSLGFYVVSVSGSYRTLDYDAFARSYPEEWVGMVSCIQTDE